MTILLSIKPQYAEAILNETKTVEFRKTPIKRDVKTALIYMSQSNKKIVGSAKVRKIVEDSPENLWEKYQTVAGISKEKFFEYFEGKIKGYALELFDVSYIPEEEQKTPDYIPQSFCYL